MSAMQMLDIRTLSLVALVTSLLLPLVLLAGSQFVGSVQPSTRALNRGVTLYASGFLLFALRGVAPDWLSVVLANLLIFGGYCELAVGFRMYFHRKVQRRLEFAGLLAMLLYLVWYTYINPSISDRIFYNSLFLGSVSSVAAYDFFIAARQLRPVDDASRAERRLLAAMCLTFALASASFMLRTYLFFGIHGEIDPSTLGGVNYGASFVVGILLNFVMAASLPLLISRRNQQELMESRELLAQTEDLALVGSLVYDLNTQKSMANQVLADMLGTRHAGDVSLHSWLERLDPQDKPWIEEKVQLMLGGDRTSIQAECRLLPSTGKAPTWVSLRCGMRHNAADQMQFIASMRDITSIKTAAQSAIEARDEADRANAAKSAFLANMSHEIRTPMNGVLGLTRLCLEGELPARERDLIEKCHAQAQSLLGIVNDILDFSKIEAGKLSVESVPFHLDTVLDNARGLFEETAGGKGLRFVVEVASEVPRGLVGDPLRLSQVLNNFLGNAVKFTQQGEVKLHIAVDAEAHASHEVRLQFAVSDSGIGMNPQQQARLFQPFSQADSSTTRRYGGSGLGLVICHRLIELMGGSLQLHSQEGVGSTFTAHLPFGISTQALALKRPTPKRLDKQLRGLRLLLVEDNPINVLVAKLSLQNQGAQVVHMENGKLAVDYLRSHAQDIDLVLMDIQMPVMDGYTATRLVRSELQLKELPVVAMTANVLDSDREASLQAGMNAHVGKPFDTQQLVQTIVQLVRGGVPLPDPGPEAPVTTAADTVSAPLLDLAPALQRMGGNEALLAQAAHSFEKDLAQMLQHLRQALDEPQSSAPAQLLHTIKGLAATLGMPRLSQAAAAMERDLKAGTPPPKSALDTFEQTALASLQVLLGALEHTTHAAPAPTASAAPAPPTDHAHRLLAGLHALLAESDMSALEYFAQHRDSLAALAPQHIGMLEEAMRELDFARAAQLCRNYGAK